MKRLFRLLLISALLLPSLHTASIFYGKSVSAITCPDGSFLPDERANECPSADPVSTLPGIEVNNEPCDDDVFEDRRTLGIPVWYAYLEGKRDVIIYEGENAEFESECVPVIVDPEDALPIGLAILEAAMVIAGFVAVVMVFVGSFGFITSQGQGDKAASARKTVINAAIGLVIILVATRVVSFIAGSIV